MTLKERPKSARRNQIKNHFVVTLEIETVLNEDEMCFSHDDNLGIVDGETEIRGLIATSRFYLSRKNSPKQNYKEHQKAIIEHIKQLINGMLENN